MRYVMTLLFLAVALSACGRRGDDGGDGGAGSDAGTDGGVDAGSGAEIRPGLIPVVLGNLVLQPGGPISPSCTTGVAPCEWVMRIQSLGSQPLIIDRVCEVGDPRDAFTVGQPDILVVAPGLEARVTITYSHTDLDPARMVDDLAVVIQSNADAQPTLVVPVCGRMLDANDRAPDPVDCTSPAPQPPRGVRDDALCP